MTENLLFSDIEEIFNSLNPDFWCNFSGKRILITGGRGFLGRYFTAAFVRANEFFESGGLLPCEVLVLDNLITSGLVGENFPEYENVTFVTHDIIQPFEIDTNVDFIIHAAGIASPFYYQKYPIETYEVSSIGTRNILNLAAQHPGVRLAYFSSSEIYGNPDPRNVPTSEDYLGYVSCLGDRAVYDESKRFGEMMVKIHHQIHGVQGVIIRPFNIFGPSQQKDDYRVLPNFAAKWVAGEKLQVYGTGRQTRTFCYVTDAIRGFLQVLVLGKPGEPYNIGNPNPEITMRDLVYEIANAVSGPIEFDILNHPDTYPSDEPQRRCPDISKATRDIGYVPTVTLQDGLRRFFEWANQSYRDQ